MAWACCSHSSGSASLRHYTRMEIPTHSTRISHIRNSVWPTFNLLQRSHILNSVRLTFNLLRMSHIRNSVQPTFNLLRISHIRNSVRPTFHLLQIFHIRLPTPDGRGGRFNFPGQTCPDSLITHCGSWPRYASTPILVNFYCVF